MDQGQGNTGLEIAREFAECSVRLAPNPAALVDDRLQVRFANSAFQNRFPARDGSSAWVEGIAPRSDVDGLRRRMTAALDRLVAGPRPETAELAIEPSAPEAGILRIVSPGRGCRWATLELVEADPGRPPDLDSNGLAEALHELRQPLQSLSLLHGLLATKLNDPAALDLLRGMEQCTSALSGMLQSVGAEISPSVHSGAAETSDVQADHVLALLSDEFAYHAWVRGVRWRAIICRATIRSNQALLTHLLRKVLAQALREQQRGGAVLLGARGRGCSLVFEVWTSGSARRAAPLAGSALDDVPASHRVSGRLLQALARGSVQTMADQLGVTLEVRRRAGDGQTLRLVVPRVEPAPERGRASRSARVANSISELATAGKAANPSGGLDRDWMIYLVDDDRALSLAMHHALQHRFVLRSFDSAEAFLEALEEEPREARGCLLVDLNLPGMDGLQLLEKVRDRHPTVSCIMITGHGEVRSAVRAMRAGAIDFVEKPIQLETLFAALQRARERAPSAKAPVTDDAKEIVARLTQRQKQIMRIVVQGQTNKEAAELLGLSKRTVENHRYEIMRRTGSDTFSDLVRLALRAGVL